MNPKTELLTTVYDRHDRGHCTIGTVSYDGTQYVTIGVKTEEGIAYVEVEMNDFILAGEMVTDIYRNYLYRDTRRT